MADVQELEQKAKTLVDQFLSQSQQEVPPKKLEGILNRLPANECHYERGVLAMANDSTDEAAEHLYKAALDECGRAEKPLSCDELYHRWLEPFLGVWDPKFWARLARAFAEKSKGSAAHLLLQAYAALEKNQSDKAEKLLVKCLRVDESYWDAAFKLGDIQEGRKNWEEARGSFERALAHARGRDKAWPYFRLGRCQLALGKSEPALDCFEKAVDCSSTSWRRAFGIGVGPESGGRTEWKRACAYDLMGLEQWLLADADGAIESLVKALESGEDLWRPAASLGDIYYDKKNWKAAKSYYEQTINRVGGNPDVGAAAKADIYSALGWCCWKIKDQEGEENAYRTCLELDPDFKYARNNLGLSLMKAGKLEEAAGVFREAIDRANDGKYPLRNLAKALRKLGRYSEAIEVLQKDTHRGRLTKSAQARIEELQALLEKQKQGEVIADEAADDLEEIDAEAESEEEGPRRQEPHEESPQIEPTARQRSAKKQAAQREPRESKTRIHREDVLEALIERRIDRGQEVFGRRLRMFQANDSPLGRYGRQFAIPDVGRIDLLAVNVDSGDLVVIELKRDKPMRDTVGQLCLYKGWVEKNLAGEGQRVFGIICVWEATESLRLATHAVPGVDVFEYDLTFAKV